MRDLRIDELVTKQYTRYKAMSEEEVTQFKARVVEFFDKDCISASQRDFIIAQVDHYRSLEPDELFKRPIQ